MLPDQAQGHCSPGTEPAALPVGLSCPISTLPRFKLCVMVQCASCASVHTTPPSKSMAVQRLFITAARAVACMRQPMLYRHTVVRESTSGVCWASEAMRRQISFRAFLLCSWASREVGRAMLRIVGKQIHSAFCASPMDIPDIKHCPRSCTAWQCGGSTWRPGALVCGAGGWAWH